MLTLYKDPDSFDDAQGGLSIKPRHHTRLNRDSFLGVRLVPALLGASYFEALTRSLVPWSHWYYFPYLRGRDVEVVQTTVGQSNTRATLGL